MLKIYQDRFGGNDAPIEQRGNCFQACVAYVLQIPLEEAFDHTFLNDDEWLDEFNKWLEQYNLGCVFIEMSEEKPVSTSVFKGIHIAECMSKTLYQGERHAVVMRDHFELLHDPNPNATEQGDFQGIYVFVPLEPAKMVRTGAMGVI